MTNRNENITLMEPFKQHLANCDLTCRNDLDGREHLSQESLFAFAKFFFETCIDQVIFMEKIMQPDHLNILFFFARK